VREDGRDGEAARALDIHEVRVGGLHETLELMAPLLSLREGVEQVDSESHCGRNECLGLLASDAKLFVAEDELFDAAVCSKGTVY